MDRPPPPPPPDPPPDYSAVNEAVTDSSGRSLAPEDQQRSPDQASGTAEMAASQGPDYSAVNEPITATDSVDLASVREIEPIHRDQPEPPGDQQGIPEQVDGTGEGVGAQPPDYSAVNEPITDNGGDLEAAGIANADQAGEENPAASDSEAAVRSDDMDRELQRNADFLDSEASRYRELGDDATANQYQEPADKARSLVGDSGRPNSTDPATIPAESELDASDTTTGDAAGEQNPGAAAAASESASESDAEHRWMDEASAVDLENFRADAYKRLGDNLSIEQSSRLGGAIDDGAEAKADAASSEVKRAQTDINEATKRINTLRYPR